MIPLSRKAEIASHTLQPQDLHGLAISIDFPPFHICMDCV